MTHSNDIVLRIRWTEGPDISLNISPSFDTPCTLKDLIHQTTQHTSNKRLRLVYNGKILDDDMKPLGDYGIQSTGTFIHCMVSEYVSTDLTKIVNKKPSRTGGGFDRLLTLGFNQEEICNIRAQFHRTRQTPYDGQEPTEQLQQLEEQWMDQTGEVLPEGSAQGTYQEIMWGLMLGFFLGILCIFWVRESVFTRRHQLGILAGMFLNVSFGYMHVYHW